MRVVQEIGLIVSRFVWKTVDTTILFVIKDIIQILTF